MAILDETDSAWTSTRLHGRCPRASTASGRRRDRHRRSLHHTTRILQYVSPVDRARVHGRTDRRRRVDRNSPNRSGGRGSTSSSPSGRCLMTHWTSARSAPTFPILSAHRARRETAGLPDSGRPRTKPRRCSTPNAGSSRPANAAAHRAPISSRRGHGGVRRCLRRHGGVHRSATRRGGLHEERHRGVEPGRLRFSTPR